MYPYSLGFLHRHWDKHMLVPVSVKLQWGTWANESHDKTIWTKQSTPASCVCIYNEMYCMASKCVTSIFILTICNEWMCAESCSIFNHYLSRLKWFQLEYNDSRPLGRWCVFSGPLEMKLSFLVYDFPIRLYFDMCIYTSCASHKSCTLSNLIRRDINNQSPNCVQISVMAEVLSI